MPHIKHIPNLLSALRIAVAFLLLIDTQPLFSVCYLLCGASDVLDGLLARRYHAQTDFGARLDSMGDFVFWLVVLVLLHTRTEVYTAPVLAGVAVVTGVRVLNLLITKAKFHQWAMLHTWGNKLTGLALFFLCFAAFLLGTAWWYVWVPVLGLALLSAVEETIILCRSSIYEPNPKGFFKASK